MPTERDTFDYVIVGAGAAGCVLANRLAAAGTHTVCLVEAGPRDRNIFLRIPAGVYKASEDSRYAWHFETEPSVGSGGRSIPLPQGKTLGGSTAINGMVYNRGNPDDFDSWARRGNRGWGYLDVLPYFKRTERRIGAGDPYYRGRDGTLPVTDSDWRHPLCDTFIEAARNLGLPHNHDYNEPSQAGVAYYQRYIENGWRVSAARAFLRPASRQSNLEIRTTAHATTVIFQGNRAVGIRYVQAPGRAPCDVKARREVILTAGAVNTPKLLQVSGVGPRSLLAELGIPIIHELPGVGADLQDHYMVHVVVRVNVETLSGRGLALVREAAKWAVGRPSILACSPSLVIGFVNSRDLCSTPDIQLDLALGNYTTLSSDRVPVLKLGVYQLRPKSRGFVRARSADPFCAPVIQPHYLLHEDDQRVVIDGIKTVRRMLGARELQSFYCVEELPGSTVASDAECLEYARQAGLTAYHVCGTCQMGPQQNPLSVVDDELRVHGLEGLRIADASIMPSVPSANTSAAVFMIAEKASDMILGKSTVAAAMSPRLRGEQPPSELAEAG